MQPIDPQTAARIALIDRVVQELAKWGDADRRAQKATADLTTAEADKNAVADTVAKCFKTARELWDFDLKAEVEKHLDALYGSRPRHSREVTAEATLAAVATATDKPKSIREFVLDTAKTAYPGPVRASAIRKQLADAGRPTHEKTVGMTLYRLLRGRYLRRKGWDWFFVPEAERQMPDDPVERESPADEAGLFEEAMD